MESPSPPRQTLCPTCGTPAVMTCKCPLYDCQCKNGHHWHRCPIRDPLIQVIDIVNTKIADYLTLLGYDFTFDPKTSSKFVIRDFTFYVTYWGIVWWEGEASLDNIHEYNFRSETLEVVHSIGILQVIDIFLDVLTFVHKYAKKKAD